MMSTCRVSMTVSLIAWVSSYGNASARLADGVSRSLE